MRNALPDGHVEIEIGRVTERRNSSPKQARPARSARLARAEVHDRRLTMPATLAGAEPVSVVHVRECAPPEGEKAVEWFLLTSLDIDDFERAVETIGYYLRRWRVEDLFRVLKSGCRAEHLGFHSAERLQRALTIQAVIAWRLMLMTLLGREVPEYDAELMFADIELRFLADYAADTALPAPRTLAAAVHLVAILGAYQSHKHDPPPGHQIMCVDGCAKPRINGEHKIWGLASRYHVFSQIGPLVAGSSLPTTNRGRGRRGSSPRCAVLR